MAMARVGLRATVGSMGVLALMIAGCSSSSSKGNPETEPDASMEVADAGACPTTTLYGRLGCEPGITKAVGAIATAEARQPGHRVVLRLPRREGLDGLHAPHGRAGRVVPRELHEQRGRWAGQVPHDDLRRFSVPLDVGRARRPLHLRRLVRHLPHDRRLDALVGRRERSDLTTIGGALSALKPQIVNPVLADAGLETLQDGIKEADASDQ